MFSDTLQTYIAQIESALFALLPNEEGSDVCEAMRYSCAVGGKRIRPVLVLEACRLCGGDIALALPFACALEMIHTYSLIHDDLPCMDNDDLRRGQPSCHKKFGEATALLAGDALLTHAFCVCAESVLAKKHPETAIRAVALLSSLAGTSGMIGGQEIDLASEGKQISLQALREMDAKKTGALIKAACALGAVIAGASQEQTNALLLFAESLGQAFQVVDDILDVEGDTATLGKPVGSDAESNKSTYVSLLGLSAAKESAKALTEQAVGALSVFGEEAAFLRELSEKLCQRTY
ncbi:MAG: polyprenyl synthetase family protein [Clostridia bacterium]|nr:polyprenyl synthetase family protein [Clostridia bacterium]